MEKKALIPAMAITALLAAAPLAATGEAAAFRADQIAVLQDRNAGEIGGEYYLSSAVDNVLWGRLPNRNTACILTVPSGGTVTIDTLSHEGILEDQGKDPAAYFGRYGIKPDGVLREAIEIAASGKPHDFDKDGPHVVTGPILVEGAEPGDVLKVEVLKLTPRVPYGVISNRHYKGALPGEFPENEGRKTGAGAKRSELYGNVSVFTPIKKIDGVWYAYLKQLNQAKEIKFPIHPFLGIMGVAPDTDESWSSIPPARIGGNIDINELGVGSTLYLPVEVKGAKFYAGDPHFAQGDGEVALTALEGSLRATVRLTVLKQGAEAIPKTNSDNLAAPFAETEKYWIPIGLHEDLDEAMKNSVRESISFLSKQFHLDRKIVYAYLSGAVDYEVSQVVDKTKGIHGLIPKVDFADYLTISLQAGTKNFDVGIYHDAFYAPAADVLSALGAEVSEKDGALTAKIDGKTIKIRENSNVYQVDGADVYTNGASPLRYRGVLLMPVSALGEAAGVSVTWSTSGNHVAGRAELRK